jgi:tetrapyrrole methylase family protein/MazG family protein
MDLAELVRLVALHVGHALDTLQAFGARALAQRHYPDVNPDHPLAIGPLERADIAALVSCLKRAYPTTHQVTLLQPGHRGDVDPLQLALGEVPHAPAIVDGAVLYVPPLACAGAIQTFQETVAHLRAPDGCPWDREQTHRSLRQGFQEEAHEVLDALDRGDIEALKEELGDVLLHILLQVQIAGETGEFTMSDVVCHANAKIVHRHPHVFDDLLVEGVDQVLVNWEILKGREKASRNRHSALDGIPMAMPALARAQSLQRHAISSETGQPDIAAACAAVVSAAADLTSLPPDDRARAMGQLLFDLAALARLLGVDAESALREASSAFEAAFRAREKQRGRETTALLGSEGG